MATVHLSTAAQAAQRHVQEALSLIRLIAVGTHPNHPQHRDLDVLEGCLRTASILIPVEPFECNVVPLRTTETPVATIRAARRADGAAITITRAGCERRYWVSPARYKALREWTLNLERTPWRASGDWRVRGMEVHLWDAARPRLIAIDGKAVRHG